MVINLHSSGAETTNGSSSSFHRSDMALVGLFVNITDVAGLIPVLGVKLQHSPDGQTWYNVGNIAVTGLNSTVTASAAPAALALLADYIRVCWTITGTNPSFTFTVDVVTKTT